MPSVGAAGASEPTYQGLTSQEAQRLLTATGPNDLPRQARASMASRIRAQLKDPLNIVLLVACALTIVTRDWTDALVIALVIVINSAVSVSQEVRAERAITALATMTAPSVRVWRDGAQTSLPSVEVVPGDIVLLAEGDIVPADGEVIEASALLVDESALTGESVPVGHGPRSTGQSGHELSAGTVVVKGRAVLHVQRTGPDSALGQIASMLSARAQPTPLQRRMAELSRVLATIAISLSALVMVLELLRGRELEPALLTAISLTVAAVPESLPAVVTVALALGAKRMASRSAIVRRLPAVETLGSVSVIATDKTGTLTSAHMAVGEIWTPQRTVTVLGDGYEPVGAFIWQDSPLDVSDAPDVLELLRAAALCNDARLLPPTGPGEAWTGLGDPTEIALLVAAGKAGLSAEVLAAEFPRVAELPFTSEAQSMSTLHVVTAEVGPDRMLHITKGSPEALHNRHHDGSFSSSWREAFQRAENLADRGYRVLAVAADRTEAPDITTSTGLRLLGLVAINDPAKPTASATIRAFRDAGITPILITGDHPATALAIARSVGIVDGSDASVVVTGQDMGNGAVADLTVPRVFARTSPAQKLEIIRAWQDSGASIAMTGDGVNDGPALRHADVGVAMGHRGTELARQSADLILADDNLETMVVAVEEGRRVYDNIRRFLIFGLAGGAAEIAVMLVGPFVGLIVPLLAAQILWINLLTHGITGVAIGAEAVEPQAMRRRPRPPAQSVLGEGLWQRVMVCGVVAAVLTLTVGVWAQGSGRQWQSLVFLTLTSLQLGVALGLRPRLFTLRNPAMPLAVALSLGLAVLGLYLPPLQQLLGTVPLSASEVGVGILVGVAGLGAARCCPARSSRRAGGRLLSSQQDSLPH